MTRWTADFRFETRLAWGGALAAGLLFLAIAWPGRSAAPEVPTALVEQAPTAARAPAAAVPAPQPVAPAPAVAHRDAAATLDAPEAASSPDGESKWARVSALIASGRPADAFAAYRILSLCAVVQDLQAVEDHSGDPGQLADRSKLDDKCGDLSPGQLGERVRLLEFAADAHVPGAVAALMNQGPDGQPVAEVWDDPAYADWRRRTLERVAAEAERGDPVSLQLMVAQHDKGQRPLSADDSAAALKYYTAYADVQLAFDPAYASPTRRESLGMLVQRISGLYREALTPDQYDAAVAAGHALVAQVVAHGAPAPSAP